MRDAGVSRETSAVPPAAPTVFGDRLGLASTYRDLLASAGVERGLIGPRESSRLWERHLLNCAVAVADVPEGASVCDVGTGAGLPGVVWAIARPDLRVTLLEPLARRTAFLTEVVAVLGLSNAEVVRARAEEHAGSAAYDVVTSRAVAPLERLLRWSVPLARPGGVVLALKGRSAEAEVESVRPLLHRLGGASVSVAEYGADLLEVPTRVVRVRVRGGKEKRPDVWS